MFTIYAVFGQPVLHSKSPQLFQPWLEPSEHYTRIRPQSPVDIIRNVKELNIKGASITAPFKESLLPLVDHISPEATAVGAINCIHQKNGFITGHNTDYYGVNGALEEAGICLKEARILVLGAGGAARSAVYGLAKAGARVSICNRTIAKAQSIATSFGAKVVSWDNPGKLPRFDAVVSALLPAAIPPFIDQLTYDLLLDAVYKPSKVSKHTAGKGIPIAAGERWLIHQGVEAAAFYMDRRPNPETLESCIHNPLDKNNLRVCILREANVPTFGHHKFDLVISAFGLDQEATNNILNEERNLAFGC